MPKQSDLLTRIISWDAVALELKLDPINSLPFPNPKDDCENATNAFFQWDKTTDVLNEDTVLDWMDSTQRKYIPIVYNYKPGSGWSFYVSVYYWSNARAYGGARLYFAKQILSDHFAKYFMDIINRINKPKTKK